MKLGLFMMPLHDPSRNYTDILKQDREAILLADQLGYDEAWVGEHYSCKTEPITSPLQFMATLIPITKRITFGTGVINLPQHHPAIIAGDVAMFDHLSEGRYIMGVGPGGLGSDFELFETFDKDRTAMMTESVDIIHQIWASDPPYRIHGKFWNVVVDRETQLHLGIGPMLKPYQKPYPPLAVSAMSPKSSTARLAGERGWGMVSANFTPSSQVLSHWQAYCEGAEKAGRRPDRANWRVARSILCAETDAEAADYLANEKCSPGWYYAYLRDNLRTYKMTKIFKPYESMSDDELTVPHMLEMMVISGSPATVLDRLVALVDEIGWFGTLLLTHKDWDNPPLHRKSMQLLAERVFPRLGQHMQTRQAAE
ncbi:MAG TPA: LLM class flavin-dependent oxidoreductase [Acetobacteraceae bacterium]|jgi:alkanesulfonate monooxygenase SsuD/methylene tetrahydromethanopterin reductase-like flavin-dependent oxidoreductase (luciferase family)|nr:LLM class flavin-dependent oxidoreductase [Acetobacteraceae bacterium]